jgi:hypothetical protein
MNKIIAYQVASESDCDKLAVVVADLMKQGFQPFGSVSAAYAPDEQKFYVFQAMVQYEQKTN